jgi:hypothetical protein
MPRHDPVRYGAYLAGPLLAPPTPIAYYARRSEPDLDALVAYLRSLPPVESDH